MDSIAKLIRLISDRLDPEEVVDILGYNTPHLCLLLRKDIIENRNKFEEFLDIYDTEEYTYDPEVD